jgi:hypothetical protein
MIKRTVDVAVIHDSLKYVRTCHDPIRRCNRLDFQVVCPHWALKFAVDWPFSQFL